MGERWQKFRRWIDNEQEEHRLEELIDKAKPGSPSMKFIVRIVDAIKADLISGGAYIPSTDNSPAYFPPIYYVFISESDSKSWTGRRLVDLQTKVAEGVMRKVEELDKNKTTQTIRIEVKADGTLNAGQIRVQSLNEFSKTDDRKDNKPFDEKSTKKDTSNKRRTLYEVEIWKDGTRLEIKKVQQKEISIGRSSSANVQLAEDERIGRTHASMLFENGQLFVISMNENPTSVGDVVLDYTQRMSIQDSEEIHIYEYTLIPKLN